MQNDLPAKKHTFIISINQLTNSLILIPLTRLIIGGRHIIQLRTTTKKNTIKRLSAVKHKIRISEAFVL